MAEPMHMTLCEFGKLVPRPGQIYIAVHIPGCEECDRLAAMQREAYGASSPTVNEDGSAGRPLTPWFPVRIQPVREGDYEYRGFLMEDGSRMTWNGNQWGHHLHGGQWVQMAEDSTDEWRGLSAPPAGEGPK